MRHFYWLSSLFLLCCSLLAGANAAKLELFTETFPPYSYLENNAIKGINADIVTQACLHSGVQCHVKLMPWERAMSITQSTENSGLFSTSRFDSREDKFLWVGPLVSSNTCFYKLKAREDIVINNNDDLLNYTIGISRGDIYQAILTKLGMKEGVNYLTFSSKNEDIRMFKLKKFDLIVGSSLTLGPQLAIAGLTPNDVTPVMELNDIALKGNFLALNKDTEKTTVSVIQASLTQLKASGKIQSIVNEYVKPLPKDSDLPLHLYRCLDGAVNY